MCGTGRLLHHVISNEMPTDIVNDSRSQVVINLKNYRMPCYDITSIFLPTSQTISEIAVKAHLLAMTN